MRSRVQSPGGLVHFSMVPLRTLATPPEEHWSQVAFWGRINTNSSRFVGKDNSKQMPWVNLEYGSDPMGWLNGTLGGCKDALQTVPVLCFLGWLPCWESWLWCVCGTLSCKERGAFSRNSERWDASSRGRVGGCFRGIWLRFHWSFIQKRDHLGPAN